MTVLDVGANAGYYTLLGSRLVGPAGSAWAFEPNPRNCRNLRRHAAINRCTNTHVEEVAVAEAEGTAAFSFGSGSGTGHLEQDGPLRVRTICLDDFCAARGVVPSVIKIDVEGAELRVLQGAEQVIRRHQPIIFLSTHGPALHARCLDWLSARGYSGTPILGGDLWMTSEVLLLPASGVDC